MPSPPHQAATATLKQRKPNEIHGPRGFPAVSKTKTFLLYTLNSGDAEIDIAETRLAPASQLGCARNKLKHRPQCAVLRQFDIVFSGKQKTLHNAFAVETGIAKQTQSIDGVMARCPLFKPFQKPVKKLCDETFAPTPEPARRVSFQRRTLSIKTVRIPDHILYRMGLRCRPRTRLRNSMSSV